MFNKLITFILNLFIHISATFISIFTLPLFTILNAMFPDFNLYFNTFNIFVNNYVIKGVSFVREVFFNCTGYPRALFNALIAYFLFRITIHTSILVFKFVINLYYIIRGSPAPFSYSHFSSSTLKPD